jgi:hypothetical protein
MQENEEEEEEGRRLLRNGISYKLILLLGFLLMMLEKGAHSTI